MSQDDEQERMILDSIDRFLERDVAPYVHELEANDNAEALLRRMGLSDRVHNTPAQISGGERQRVAVARALINTPKILLADEPTGALDTETSGDIMKLFADLNGQGVTVIIVTHDMKLAQDVSDHVVFLHKGVIEEEGPPDTLFSAPKSERLPGPLDVAALSWVDDDGTRVVENVSFNMPLPGSALLTGSADSGKSQLARLIARLLTPTGGRIRVDGVDLTAADPVDLRTRIALVPQDTTIFAASARDNIAFGDPSASDEAIVAAARQALADGFVSALPEGYGTLLGERGDRGRGDLGSEGSHVAEAQVVGQDERGRREQAQVGFGKPITGQERAII